jgi:hypothetical protein
MADAILDWSTFVDGDASIVTGPQEAYRIKEIGTDKTSAITPTINGNTLGAIRQEVAALQYSATTEHGPLELMDLYYYIPPETELTLDGASGDTVHLGGEAIDSPSGRFESSADETRFNQQGSYHYTFVQGSVAVSEPLSDRQEEVPLSLTPQTDERFTFDQLHSVGTSSSGSTTIGFGDLALLFNFDGQRRPSQFSDDEIVGVDVESLPQPPSDSTTQKEFVYGMMDDAVDPFTVSGDQTYEAVIRNVSGGSIGSSGNTLTLDYIAGVEFREGV